MAIFTKGWFGRPTDVGGQPAERHKLPGPVELRHAAVPTTVDVTAAPGWLGVVATVRGRDGDRAVWVYDDVEPWATGAGFVFASVGAVPVSALPGGAARPLGDPASVDASSYQEG